MAKKHSRAMDTVAVLGEKTHRRVTVAGPVPTLVAPIQSWRNNVFFYNNGASTVYIGKHTLNDPVEVLSAANGIPIANGGNFNDDSSYDEWWGITADGAAGQLIVIETSVGGN